VLFGAACIAMIQKVVWVKHQKDCSHNSHVSNNQHAHQCMVIGLPLNTIEHTLSLLFVTGYD
jgi:hypothetical protein